MSKSAHWNLTNYCDFLVCNYASLDVFIRTLVAFVSHVVFWGDSSKSDILVDYFFSNFGGFVRPLQVLTDEEWAELVWQQLAN